ncbi:MAG: DUF4330 family protein [Oscillospiraceae bacterium]|nr:DUF4330 family protein [Oscillospiraceae bacterium]
MNNEKKKGRFNIIDLIVIILLVFAVVFIAYKLLPKNSDNVETQKVRITYYMEKCADFVPAHTQIGDTLYVSDTNLQLGVVTDIRVEDYQPNIESANDENYCSIYITGEVDAVMSEHGPLVGNTLFGIGHTMVIYAGMGKYYVAVYDAELVQ